MWMVDLGATHQVGYSKQDRINEILRKFQAVVSTSIDAETNELQSKWSESISMCVSLLAKTNRSSLVP